MYPGITASPVSGKPNTAFSPEIFRTLTRIGEYSRKTLNKKNDDM